MDDWTKTLLLVVAAKINKDGPLEISESDFERVTKADITRLHTYVDHLKDVVGIHLDPKAS